MAAIMDTLHDDHENILKLLVVLERQCDSLDEGGNPDYDLLEEIVEYCLAYPDIYHHPWEDAVYERLQSKSPEVTKELGALQEQHDALQQLTRRLGDTVRELEGEVVMPREPVVQLMRDFIDFYRGHIDWEETAFFPAAERCLAAEDWERLDELFDSQQDPLFASPAKDQYLAIRNDIRRAAEAD
ncbi:MAG: hemerythrin domain-containing protein [Gammaproteobacteria bacterium]|nr:hemerythrin domain-containing protein [Gammaproteobacteria bacterium]